MYRATATTLAGVPRVQDGMVAGQGGYAGATPLIGEINIISAVQNPNSGVRLPPARAGIGLMVVNATTATIRVYGYSQLDTIALGNPGAFFSIGPGGADFTCVRDGQWGVILGSSMTVRPAALDKLVHIAGFIDDPYFPPGEDIPPLEVEEPPPEEPPP